ncbi:MAG TPA: hypothetical protein VMI31_06375 [Fimbriimonadaceae bacterium]|nr:hypothetical protein [Fimbriimonadaceae bacterium]
MQFLPIPLPLLGTAKPEEISVAGRYDGPEGAHVEGIGVCQFQLGKAECWNMDGRAAPDLARRIDDEIAKFPSSHLLDRIPSPNRFLAYRQDLGRDTITFVSAGPGPKLGLAEPRGATIEFEPVMADPPETSLTFIISDRGHSPSKEIALREGAETKVGDCHVEIGSIRETSTQNAPIPLFSSTHIWRIVVGATSVRPSGPVDLQFLDEAGATIIAVDPSGKPVSLTELKKVADSHQLTYAVPASFAATNEVLPDACAGVTNVDPKRVKSVRVTILKQRRVTITGFPVVEHTH